MQRETHHPRRLGLIAAVAAGVLVSIGPRDASADLIFDFEDGTFQGWETNPNVSIAPTHEVFGPGDAIALFGIDGAAIGMSVDLTNVDQLILDVFTPSSARLDSSVFYVLVRPGATPPFDVLSNLVPGNYLANPGQLVLSLAHLTGVHDVQISWNSLYFPMSNSELLSRRDVVPSRPETIYFPAYIDKITFTTAVPEPAAVALMVAGVVASAIGRRRRLLG